MPKAFATWVSQIDNRTTIVCLDANGMVVEPHELFVTMAGALEGPPAHWGCRSILDIRTLTVTREVTFRDRANEGRRFQRRDRRQGRRALTDRRQTIGKEKYQKQLERARATNPPPGVPYLDEYRSRGPMRLLEKFADDTGKVTLGPVRPPTTQQLTAKPSIESSVKSGIVREEQIGMSGASKVDFADGTSAVVRTGDFPGAEVREELSLKIGKRMGVNVPDHDVIDGRLYARFIDDAETASDFKNNLIRELRDRDDLTFPQLQAHLNDNYKALIETADARKNGLFDYVTIQGDRHESNWMIGNDGNVWLIDHEFSFKTGHSFVNSPFAEKYRTGWSAAEIRATREIVEEFQDDFARAGLNQEYDDMIGRLDYAEKNGEFDPDVIWPRWLDPEGKLKV